MPTCSIREARQGSKVMLDSLRPLEFALKPILQSFTLKNLKTTGNISGHENKTLQVPPGSKVSDPKATNSKPAAIKAPTKPRRRRSPLRLRSIQKPK